MKPEAWIPIGGAALVVVLSVVPELDLQVSRAFYREGEGFYLNTHPILQGIKYGTLWAMRVVDAMLVVAAALAWLRPGGWLAHHRKHITYLMLAAMLGPGLIVNGLLKENWGRARPNDVQEFGGTQSFTPALVPAKQCDHNCSFSSGHAAAGFYLLSFMYLGRAWYRRWLLIGLVAGLTLSAARVMQGGHFLSDVIASGLITWGSAYLIARWHWPDH